MRKDAVISLRAGFAPIIVGIVAILLLVFGTGIWYYASRPPAVPAQSAVPAPQANQPAYPANSTSQAGMPPSVVPVVPSGAYPTGTANNTVVAQNVIIINANRSFTLPEFPDANFHIGKIYKATGGVSTSRAAPCGNMAGGPNFIFMTYDQPGAAPSGLCFDADHGTTDSAPTSLVVMNFSVSNNGETDVWGKFVKLFYYVTASGGQNLRLAQENPPWGGYGATAFSDRSINLGFMVPSNVDQFSLVYGNFGAMSVGGNLSKITDGFLIDFKTGTIVPIPG